jgi:hypothetical protein
MAAIADRHGFTFWTIVAGFEAALNDLMADVEGAVDRCRMSLALLQSISIVVWLPCWMGAVSEELLRQGELDQVPALLADAKAIATATGAHYWSAALARQEGELLLASGDESGLLLLRDAVDLAERQGCTFHLLTSRTSLAQHTGSAADRDALAALVGEIGAGPPRQVAAARAVLG